MATAEHQIGTFIKAVPRLKKMEHPLDIKNAASKNDARTTQERSLSIVKPNGLALVPNKDKTSVKISPNGTVTTYNEDGSRSEIRANGTIIAYFADGSIKFFRTGCWSG